MNLLLTIVFVILAAIVLYFLIGIIFGVVTALVVLLTKVAIVGLVAWGLYKLFKGVVK